MKLIKIVDALPSLQKLAKCELGLQKLYKISKLLDTLEDEISFYHKQRKQILEKYCDLVGDQYIPREEEKLNAEMSELLNMEVESQISEVTLSLEDDVKLSYNDLVALNGFVRIEE